MNTSRRCGTRANCKPKKPAINRRATLGSSLRDRPEGLVLDDVENGQTSEGSSEICPYPSRGRFYESPVESQGMRLALPGARPATYVGRRSPPIQNLEHDQRIRPGKSPRIKTCRAISIGTGNSACKETEHPSIGRPRRVCR
jgi:hypothetical protein